MEVVRDRFIALGLPVECITVIFEAEQQMKVIARITIQLVPKYELAYHNTRGVLCQELQADMFRENVPEVDIGATIKQSIQKKMPTMVHNLNLFESRHE